MTSYYFQNNSLVMEFILEEDEEGNESEELKNETDEAENPYHISIGTDTENLTCSIISNTNNFKNTTFLSNRPAQTDDSSINDLH